MTTAVSVYVNGDNGGQSSGTGTLSHQGNGAWNYAPTQAETNYSQIAFTFVHATGVIQTVQVFTTFPQTGDSYAIVSNGTYGNSAIKTIVAAIGLAMPSAATIATAVWNAVTRTLTYISPITVTGDVTLAASQPNYAPAKASDIPSAASIWGYGTRTLTGGTIGAGSIAWPVTVELTGGAPLDGVDVWATTDEAGTNVVSSTTTNDHGVATLMLDPGSYYVWCQRSGDNFPNPTVITVS